MCVLLTHSPPIVLCGPTTVPVCSHVRPCRVDSWQRFFLFRTVENLLATPTRILFKVSPGPLETPATLHLPPRGATPSERLATLVSTPEPIWFDYAVVFVGVFSISPPLRDIPSTQTPEISYLTSQYTLILLPSVLSMHVSKRHILLPKTGDTFSAIRHNSWRRKLYCMHSTWFTTVATVQLGNCTFAPMDGTDWPYVF